MFVTTTVVLPDKPAVITVPETAVDGVEAQAESRRRLRELVADLWTLPERQRSALVMRELSGLS